MAAYELVNGRAAAHTSCSANLIIFKVFVVPLMRMAGQRERSVKFAAEQQPSRSHGPISNEINHFH
jgi:hypothetical protein